MFVLNWKALPNLLKQMADEFEMKTTTENKTEISCYKNVK